MHAEVHAFRGRSDAVIQLGDTVYVIEFKLAHNAEALPASILEGQGQMAGRDYVGGCRAKGRRVLEAVVSSMTSSGRLSAFLPPRAGPDAPALAGQALSGRAC